MPARHHLLPEQIPCRSRWYHDKIPKSCWGLIAIRSFADDRTEAVFNDQQPKGLPVDILKIARRKLRYLHGATSLDDVKIPPGNRLHPLLNDRAGQHAIWINNQWRICFRWTSQGPEEVEIADYH